MRIEPGVTPEELSLLNARISSHPANPEETWNKCQSILDKTLIRWGSEHEILDLLARFALPGSIDGVWLRIGLAVQAAYSTLFEVLKRGPGRTAAYRLAGLYRLMELSAAAGYSTFCLSALVRALDNPERKMEMQPVQRMKDTFKFLSTMVSCRWGDPAIDQEIARVRFLHNKYGVAAAGNKGARDFFLYILLNMFFIGPRRRPDITAEERWALCLLSLMVAAKMGHRFEYTVLELEEFIDDYEAKHFFKYDDPSPTRQVAIRIAKASRLALIEIPTVSAERIDSLVPHGVKRILGLV
jgi:hypothetical protein